MQTKVDTIKVDDSVFQFKDHSPFSKEVKVLSEVEKIWILYDLDGNETLDFEELKPYLLERAYPHLSLPEEDLKEIWGKIDLDKDGSIDKAEMGVFVKKLMEEDGSIQKFAEPTRPMNLRRVQRRQ